MTPNDVMDSKLNLDAQQEAELKQYEEQLRKELGIGAEETRHFTRPEERPFLKQTRESTTILFGGLTVAHDQLIQQAVQGLGYKVQPLEVPDNEALSIGKEFGNRGQCNPTYYTVGNLVKYLQDTQKEKGLTTPAGEGTVRVPDRRRLRPLPLRHVRGRVPQGPARQRL